MYVGVPEGKDIGLFTKGGHYITAVSTDGKEVCLLDPSYKAGKFDIPERQGRVDASRAPFLYCSIETLAGEVSTDRYPKYYLFARKR